MCWPGLYLVEGEREGDAGEMGKMTRAQTPTSLALLTSKHDGTGLRRV